MSLRDHHQVGKWDVQRVCSCGCKKKDTTDRRTSYYCAQCSYLRQNGMGLVCVKPEHFNSHVEKNTISFFDQYKGVDNGQVKLARRKQAEEDD